MTKKVNGSPRKSRAAPRAKEKPEPEGDARDSAETVAKYTDMFGAMAWACAAATCKLVGVVFYALAVAFGGVSDESGEKTPARKRSK